MELKSVSSLTFYAKDLNATADFYKTLGFRFGEQTERSLTMYLNWFSLTFVAIGSEDKPEFREEAGAEPKGGGLYINIKVTDADEFYKGVVAKGLEPSSEPRDWPWGNREFVMRDPDGYKLVFFSKL
jgi:catechol 2,3-dioxygenase-like lactoylglutathione lyase family enzyme